MVGSQQSAGSFYAVADLLSCCTKLKQIAIGMQLQVAMGMQL